MADDRQTVNQKYCNIAYVISSSWSLLLLEWVIEMGKESVEKGYVSLVHRTIDTQMTAELMEDYAFAAAIARSLKDFFLAYFNTYLGSDRSDGQLLYRAIPADVPPGIEVAKIKTLPVRLTLFDPSDLEVIINGTVYLQRHRIIRITNEAYDQGGVLTQADLSLLLGESLRTISTRIAELKNEGIIVPTRGNKKDIGPGISHKVTIVELYLKGHDFTDIKRRTRHSSESISRYLNDFARVACLAERQHTMGETRIITGHSEHLIQQYLDLKASLVDEETIGRYNQLTARFAGGKKRSPYAERGDHLCQVIQEGHDERKRDA